jgi:hypothetical protein
MPTRSVDNLAKAMGGSGIGKGEVGHLFDKTDSKMKSFLPRRSKGRRTRRGPCLWTDAADSRSAAADGSSLPPP